MYELPVSEPAAAIDIAELTLPDEPPVPDAGNLDLSWLDSPPAAPEAVNDGLSWLDSPPGGVDAEPWLTAGNEMDQATEPWVEAGLGEPSFGSEAVEPPEAPRASPSYGAEGNLPSFLSEMDEIRLEEEIPWLELDAEDALTGAPPSEPVVAAVDLPTASAPAAERPHADADAAGVLEEVASRLERIAQSLRERTPAELLRTAANDPLQVLIAGYALGLSESSRVSRGPD